MALAIFDLDNTLLHGDSEILWWAFLADKGLVARNDFAEQREQLAHLEHFTPENLQAYVEVTVKPMAQFKKDQLLELRSEFIRERIEPVILPQGEARLKAHRDKGDYLLIITATNRFITAPIATRLGVDDLIATEIEENGNAYTGRVIGTPSFREGKVSRLQTWLKGKDHTLEGSYFYSDSPHDAPLLRLVSHPFAVDPHPDLAEIAKTHGWTIISLRD